MDVFSNHSGDWIILCAIVGGLFYTLHIVGQESSTFKEESYELQFGELSLRIPEWWTITFQDKTKIKFERTDTRYDWFAVFEYFPDHQDKKLPDLLEEKLNLEKIEFDMDVVFETDSRVLFRDEHVQKHFQELIRVEGQGSQDVVDRIYYDVFVMRGLDDKGYFIFESRSSVLNGLVEGPYFEESLAELKFIQSP
jgi:hypothetical protein